MDHICTIENWEQNIDFMEEGHRTGFRLRFDSGIDLKPKSSEKPKTFRLVTTGEELSHYMEKKVATVYYFKRSRIIEKIVFDKG